MSAESVRRIDGSVDLRTGDIDCEGDLEITGGIADNVTVRAAGSIHVMGVIGSANVTAGKNLNADGGINGRQKGACKAGGEVRAKYVINATIEAEGNVTAVVEVLNSQVTCGGKLVVDDGPLLGGHVTAAGGVRCRLLGNHAGVTTVVDAGIDTPLQDAALRAVREIEADRKRAAKIREIVQPLMRNQKALSAEQKEKATELLFEADEIETRCARATDEIRARYQAAEGRLKPEIRVIETAFPGVTVHLPGLEATIDAAVQGPIWISPRGAENDRRISLVCDSGVAIDLHTRPVTEGAMVALQRLLLKAA